MIKKPKVSDGTKLDNQTKGEFAKFASEFHIGLTSGNFTDNTLNICWFCQQPNTPPKKVRY